MAISQAEIKNWIDTNTAGMSQAQKQRAVFDTMKKYSVSTEQVSSAMGGTSGWDLANVQRIYDRLNTPETAASPMLDTASLLQEAFAGTRGGMRYTPQRVQGQGYNAQTIAGQDLSQYMNPYTQQVIDASLSDLERQRQMQMNNLGFSATQAGAFGGSRHGVAEALTNEGFANQGAQMAANLRNQGYGQALQTAGQDVGAINQAAQYGAGAINAANLANQNAGLQGAQLNLSAANQMGNLSNLGFNQMNTLNTNAFNQGLAQQQMNQQLINNAMQQYNAMTNYPSSSLGYMGQALGLFPNLGTTTQTSNPGLFNYLSMGLGAYGMLR